MARCLPAVLLQLYLGWIEAATPVVTNNLDSLIQDDKLKFVFVGGKGGVGKTTSSSAIAAQLSLSLSKATNSNKRVLLISTDPAHSLSDAFRMQFSQVPTPIKPELPNLEVMEVDPTAILNKELSGWKELATELGFGSSGNATDDETNIGGKIFSFQEWLSGIPGIDEATALSSAIEHIESGRYDMIVFDTAPTGHTLKLLELPAILQVGLNKLESWQATMWGYWESFKQITTGDAGDYASPKEKIAKKLRDYKESIGRVSDMIKDKDRTRFVVVCIAEYLSISETRRLLSELDKNHVPASHVVVNQLVTDYLEPSELKDFEQYVSIQESAHVPLLEKALAAAKLTTSRRNIQSKYLKDLRSCPEVQRHPDPEDATKTNRRAGTEPLNVLEVPLLPSEVTGPKAIMAFSHYLVGKELDDAHAKSVGVEGERSKKARAAEKKQQEEKQAPSTIAGVTADDMLQFRKKTEEAKTKEAERKKMTQEKADDMIDKVMGDPELSREVMKSPKLLDILDEVKKNPLLAMKHMKDPEVGPFLKKAVDKLFPEMAGMLARFGGGGNKKENGQSQKRAGKGRGTKKKKTKKTWGTIKKPKPGDADHDPAMERITGLMNMMGGMDPNSKGKGKGKPPNPMDALNMLMQVGAMAVKDEKSKNEL